MSSSARFSVDFPSFSFSADDTHQLSTSMICSTEGWELQSDNQGVIRAVSGCEFADWVGMGGFVGAVGPSQQREGGYDSNLRSSFYGGVKFTKRLPGLSQ
jgi:hypothetical protein